MNRLYFIHDSVIQGFPETLLSGLILISGQRGCLALFLLLPVFSLHETWPVFCCPFSPSRSLSLHEKRKPLERSSAHEHKKRKREEEEETQSLAFVGELSDSARFGL